MSKPTSEVEAGLQDNLIQPLRSENWVCKLLQSWRAPQPGQNAPVRLLGEAARKGSHWPCLLSRSSTGSNSCLCHATGWDHFKPYMAWKDFLRCLEWSPPVRSEGRALSGGCQPGERGHLSQGWHPIIVSPLASVFAVL